jgi:hypothetical protein
MDDQGNPLFNYCDTYGYFYGKIVGTILDRARKEFDLEVTIDVKKQKQFHPTR